MEAMPFVTIPSGTMPVHQETFQAVLLRVFPEVVCEHLLRHHTVEELFFEREVLGPKTTAQAVLQSQVQLHSVTLAERQVLEGNTFPEPSSCTPCANNLSEFCASESQTTRPSSTTWTGRQGLDTGSPIPYWHAAYHVFLVVFVSVFLLKAVKAGVSVSSTFEIWLSFVATISLPAILYTKQGLLSKRILLKVVLRCVLVMVGNNRIAYANSLELLAVCTMLSRSVAIQLGVLTVEKFSPGQSLFILATDVMCCVLGLLALRQSYCGANRTGVWLVGS